MSNLIAIFTALFYLAVLFAVAYFAEYRLKKGKSIINNGYVYALSLAVYCTAWTYYGSVGRASTNGIEFLAIYLGPTIAAVLFWPVLRKIIRICKTQSINSIADLISTRYGKNFSVAVIVTILCVLGIIPYIALQLKAISNSIHILTNNSLQHSSLSNFWNDDTFYIALILSIFIILFGTRSIDASEKHEGLVAAIAFESIIKLVAFFAVGIFIVYAVFNGFGDIFSKAFENESLKNLFQLGTKTSYATWLGLMMASMLAVIFLPRQFQVSVVENMQEKHLKKAAWLFPLYLVVINIFVLPIAIAGKLIFSNTNIDADTYVLALPLYFNQIGLSLFVFIGGFSAATSMIIVETIALSTMFSNNIATPLFLSAKKFKPAADGKFSRSILNMRRISIVVLIALAYIYDKTIAENVSLVSMGLVSFVAVAQFAPAAIGGIYWKSASKNAAIASICVGFAIWFFTLVLPSLVSAHILNENIMTNGLLGLSWLKPFSLFGLEGMDSITHSFFWTMFFNVIVFVTVSLNSKKTAEEIYQGEIFVDIFKHSTVGTENVVWKGTAYLPDINSLLQNFLGKERSQNLVASYAIRNKISLETKRADPRLVVFAERILAGVIGSASASIMVRSVTKEEVLKVDEVLKILRESQQMIELNKELKKKSAELQKATQQLTTANELLKEMDLMKDEFLYTVTHEIRTPITSIRAMTEIVHDNTDMPEAQRQLFLGNVIKETERLSHLIMQVLNLERFESGQQQLSFKEVQLNLLIADAIESLQALADEKNIAIQKTIQDSMFLVRCDEVLMQQVLYNLISNAIKYVDNNTGKIRVSVHTNYDEIQIWVEDNGPGILPELHELIFDKFFQAKNQTLKKPEGSGLGLAICKKIIEMHGGRIWVESDGNNGSKFIFTLPQ
ncbi:MAG: ATP-binding protein [Ferruginibacter sp.]|nr:histidine kinase [Ferruginibacter sp.]